MYVDVCGHVGQMVTGCHVASRGAVGCKRVVELDMSEFVEKKYVFDLFLHLLGYKWG